jgi:L-fuconolactonase
MEGSGVGGRGWGKASPTPRIVDAHVHFWDPAELNYPWLENLPALRRAFAPADYHGAAARDARAQIAGIIFVEANCRPEEAPREVAFVERLAAREPRIAGIVAFVDLGARGGDSGLGGTLDELSASPRVKGIRQNIQGQPSGFCLQRAFVEGVREIGRRGLAFDLCVTHDQLPDATALVGQCPGTRFVLDHCGKPAIRNGGGGFKSWRADVARLAAHSNVWCKLSGLLTETGPAGWREEDLTPYAAAALDAFGAERVMYGSDWPVLTLAGSYRDWYQFTEHFTSAWTATDRARFYEGNARQAYRL